MVPSRLGRAIKTDQFALPVRGHLPVAREGRQHVGMSQVLRPRLQLLGRHVECYGMTHQHVAEAVRAIIGQARRREGFAEYCSNRLGRRAALRRQPGRGETARLIETHRGCREQRIG